MKKVLFTSVMRIAILGINSYNDSSRSIKQTKAEQGEFRVRFCAIEMPLYTSPTLAFRDSSKSYTYQAPQEKNPKSEIMIEHCDGQLAALQELGESE